ncbi:hypothetical protein CGRA01v4_11433 [Colletotrichum graminicola]|nr:hypothetical protein CGRA01v4_11433 [Colletotrichum graminicola]
MHAGGANCHHLTRLSSNFAPLPLRISWPSSIFDTCDEWNTVHRIQADFNEQNRHAHCLVFPAQRSMSQPLAPQTSDPALSEQIWIRVTEARPCFGEVMSGCPCPPNASCCTCPLSDRQRMIPASWSSPVLPTAVPCDSEMRVFREAYPYLRLFNQMLSGYAGYHKNPRGGLDIFGEVPSGGQKQDQDTKVASFSFFSPPLRRPALGCR